MPQVYFFQISLVSEESLLLVGVNDSSKKKRGPKPVKKFELSCEYCGKTFCRSDVKFRHVRKAHNIDCVKCPICQVAYNSIDHVE